MCTLLPEIEHITSISSTTAASATFTSGTMIPRKFSWRAAAMAIGSAPFALRVASSSDNSPTTAYLSKRSDAIWPLPASTPSEIGRSKEEACLGSSAGGEVNDDAVLRPHERAS